MEVNLGFRIGYSVIPKNQKVSGGALRLSHGNRYDPRTLLIAVFGLKKSE